MIVNMKNIYYYIIKKDPIRDNVLIIKKGISYL